MHFTKILNLTFPININYSIIYFKNNKLLLLESYSKNGKNYIIFLKLTNQFYVNGNSNSVSMLNNKMFNKEKLLENFFNNFFFSLSYYYHFKIKFKGKGFKIRKKKKTIKFFFYFSHINLVKMYNLKLKKIGKQKFIIFGCNKLIAKKTGLKISKIRLAGLFTKRGLRLGHHKLFKRKGKKNAYTK